jgi:hypothetical protein
MATIHQRQVCSLDDSPLVSLGGSRGEKAFPSGTEGGARYIQGRTCICETSCGHCYVQTTYKSNGGALSIFRA